MTDYKKIKLEFEEAYSTKGKAVWTKKAPEELTKIMDKIKPCKAIDLGCGEGLYSIYLNSKGFDIQGVDISDKAISYAKKNAKNAGKRIKFYQMNLLKGLKTVEDKFDFVLEWAIMHSIPFEDRKMHVENVANLLNKGGKYISTCFNIDSPEWGGHGKRVRQAEEINTTLYYSSKKELEELFSPYFNILEQQDIILKGNIPEVTHKANLFLLEKK